MSVFPLQHHSVLHTKIKFVIKHFPSLVSALLFSANCLNSLIRSNRIRLSVFSGHTFCSTGGVSPFAFHLFLMAGASGIGLRSPLPLAHSGLSLHSPPPRVALMVRVNSLKLRSSFHWAWFSDCWSCHHCSEGRMSRVLCACSEATELMPGYKSPTVRPVEI